MDLIREVGKRFNSAAAKAGRRLSHASKSQSRERHGERLDPAERLMDKILKASRPGSLGEKKPPAKPKQTEKKSEPVILPVPKDSAHG